MLVQDITKKTGRNYFYITPRLICLLTFPPYFRCHASVMSIGPIHLRLTVDTPAYFQKWNTISGKFCDILVYISQ